MRAEGGSKRYRTVADKLSSDVDHPRIEGDLTNDGYGEDMPGARLRSVKIRSGEHAHGLAHLLRRENTVDDRESLIRLIHPN